jgi:hypothetical protein
MLPSASKNRDLILYTFAAFLMKGIPVLPKAPNTAIMLIFIIQFYINAYKSG